MGDVNLVVNKNDAEVQIANLKNISEPLTGVYQEINNMRDKLISYLGDEGKWISDSLGDLSNAEKNVREKIEELINVIQRNIQDAEATDNNINF